MCINYIIYMCECIYIFFWQRGGQWSSTFQINWDHQEDPFACWSKTASLGLMVKFNFVPVNVHGSRRESWARLVLHCWQNSIKDQPKIVSSKARCRGWGSCLRAAHPTARAARTVDGSRVDEFAYNSHKRPHLTRSMDSFLENLSRLLFSAHSPLQRLFRFLVRWSLCTFTGGNCIWKKIDQSIYIPVLSETFREFGTI